MSSKDRRRFLWVLFLIGLALIAAVAQATTLVRLRFQDLVHYSNSIARVRCLHADTLTENGEIWTDTTFRVLSHNKGYLPEEIVVRQPGGTFQHLHSNVDGTPEFRSGEQGYLFIVAHSGNPFLIVGWTQGTFRIHRDLRSGGETVTQDSAETPVFDPASNSFSTGGFKNVALDAF